MRILTSLSLFLACVAALCATGHTATSTYPPSQTTGGVVVPYYGAAYGQSNTSQADNKRIIELLESIDRRMESLESRAGGPLALKRPDPLPVAKSKCVACHTPGKAEAKGGGFILFADDAASALKPLNAREKNLVKQAIQSGAMPPQGKLNAAEKAVFDW